ncbi:unnamed protein product [Tuber aestivum]|uniref:Uncharacterized protein n=1 Tax=Tuber aestivum TaxID=59557 RepID=A0A292PXD6_9PEZI|nr:unnamed protein product [Tuber aestivum]
MSSATQVGHVYWLEHPPKSQSLSFDSGKLNHPTLVLGAEREGKVQAVVITSFGGRTLSDKFPDTNNNHLRMRAEYLPLNVAGAAPHPDNDVLLSVIVGFPPMLTKKCYVRLDPFDVEVGQLRLDRRSTCMLPDDMMVLLMGRLLQLKPHFRAHKERSGTAGGPISARRQRPPVVHLPQSPPRLPLPVPTQQSALLPPPRTYSNSYGTATASRHYHHGDLEWNAPAPPRPPYPRTPRSVEDDEPNCSGGWSALGYLGIAAGIFVAVRYLFR